MTRGPPNHPEKRNYTMVIRDDPNMPYLREKGIIALANHEVGTHFVRFYNDALQPWGTNRKNYKLRKRGNVVGLHTEEGLASLATLFSSNCKLLYKAALHYCKYSSDKNKRIKPLKKELIREMSLAN